MRSAQFGVSGRVRDLLGESSVKDRYGSHALLSGMAGGVGRAMVEIPTDYLKIRRQVERSWSFKSLLDGSAVTVGRNVLLFTSFVLWIDASKEACKRNLVPGFLMADDGKGLKPFAKGAVAANMAWLTVWPLDVVKTQRQSGNYQGKGALHLLKENLRGGLIFRGVMPGLVRSTLANGSSMVVYEMVHNFLSNRFHVDRKDLV